MSDIGPSCGSRPPQEKHPSRESDSESSEEASSSVTVPTGSQFCNLIYKSVNFDRSCTTGWDGRIAPSKRCISSSWSDGIVAFGGGRCGVSNNFLMMSSSDSVPGDSAGDWLSSVTWQMRRMSVDTHLPTTRNLDMTLPHTTTVYYVRHGSIGAQTITVSPERAPPPVHQ